MITKSQPLLPPLLLEDQTLRDGLQMEIRLFSLAEKLAAFDLLLQAGFRRIQVGSFVNSRRVPQMADTDELIHVLLARPDLPADQHVSALILNSRGLDRALACGIQYVNMSVSVSDTHSRRNAGQPAKVALRNMAELITAAGAAGLKVSAGLQCVFGCAWEGAIEDAVTLKAAESLLQGGVQEISLADTTGMATPLSIRRIVRLMQTTFPEVALTLHLHDTRGLGLANMFAGYEMGVRQFDVCVGGLGGCPFIQGAAGNVPAEDAANMFESMGITTGLDLERLCHIVAFFESRLERTLPGRMRRVHGFNDKIHSG